MKLTTDIILLDKTNKTHIIILETPIPDISAWIAFDLRYNCRTWWTEEHLDEHFIPVSNSEAEFIKLLYTNLEF